MFISVKNSAVLKKTMKYTLIAALVILAFALVYEYFSFGVWSASMMTAFLYPAAAALICALYLRPSVRVMPGALAREIFLYGMAALCAGSVVTGIIEIYGSDSGYTWIYFAAGWALALAAVIMIVSSWIDIRRNS